MLLHRQLQAPAPLDPSAAAVLLSTARALRRADGTPLAGKNIALMCGTAGDASGAFTDAATRLGARVAQIEPAQPGVATARLLEHLYDAIDCEALPPGFAQQLQQRLKLPVFDGLARADHPMFALLERPDMALDRCTLVQAALVGTLL